MIEVEQILYLILHRIENESWHFGVTNKDKFYAWNEAKRERTME